MVPTRPEGRPPLNLNSELHPSFSAAAMSLLGRRSGFSAAHWADPSESELSTQLNSASGD